MDLDLRVVRYFVVVADELHFGRAAARLYISQPALSKQIRRLEEQLGAPLLVRDSRHVTLTPRGEAFLGEARQLLRLAERMQRGPQTDSLRIAHIFELDTSRALADAFTAAHPEVPLEERALDSVAQLRALLEHRLDVAIIRVSARMLAEHPGGWKYRLLRLEPMWLVGRRGDAGRPSASLRERPIEVFGDSVASGLYNAHGDYLTAFEEHTGLRMRWLGTPGAFSHCLAALSRATESAFVLEFDSYATRYAEAGLPVHRPAELQPYYPWSIAWREEPPAPATAAFLAVADEVARRRRWLATKPGAGPPAWLPADDPAAGRIATPQIAPPPPVAP
jgi:DNA-binding transcriptional LysR family regulator